MSASNRHKTSLRDKPVTDFMVDGLLRRAMVAPNREPLRRAVEVDETYMGGPKPGKRGRGAGGKSTVVGAVVSAGTIIDSAEISMHPANPCLTFSLHMSSQRGERRDQAVAPA